MALSRTAIVQGLQQLVGAANVVTDEQELKRSSIDRLRLYEDVHGLYTRPLPAAVAMARSTQHVADVLRFANQNRVNVVARTGRTATEGGLETAAPHSRCRQNQRVRPVGVDRPRRYIVAGHTFEVLALSGCQLVPTDVRIWRQAPQANAGVGLNRADANTEREAFGLACAGVEHDEHVHGINPDRTAGTPTRHFRCRS